MNFQDLLSKLKSIDESMQPEVQAVSAPPSGPDFPADGNAQLECGNMPAAAPQGADSVLIGEKGVDECGDMPGGPQVSVRSLIAALQAIEKGTHMHGGDVPLVGMGEEQPDGGFGDATTEPEEHTFKLSTVTRVGNDLASKGAEAPKVNGGGNPMHEALVRKLTAHYNQIKES